MRRVFSLFQWLQRDIVVMVLALFNRETPICVRAVLLLDILYFISPLDIIPDTIPFLGGVDDILLFQAAMKLLPQGVREESEETVSRLAWRVKIVLFLVTLAMVLWLSFILFVIYRAIF
jgi:putative membrane protein